jgi:hypothetical protein
MPTQDAGPISEYAGSRRLGSVSLIDPSD